VGQYNNLQAYLFSGIYRINRSIPKYIFNKRYPKKSITFGDTIRTMRLNAGLQIKDLAKILMVTQDSVINWEIRNVSPSPQNLNKINQWVNHLL